MLYESQQVVMYQTPFAGSDERHWVRCGAEEEVWDEVPPSFNGLASIPLADFEAANLKPTSACVTADEAGERRPLQ